MYTVPDDGRTLSYVRTSIYHHTTKESTQSCCYLNTTQWINVSSKYINENENGKEKTKKIKTNERES